MVIIGSDGTSSLKPSDKTSKSVVLVREVSSSYAYDGKAGVGIAFMREDTKFVIKQLDPAGSAGTSKKVTLNESIVDRYRAAFNPMTCKNFRFQSFSMKIFIAPVHS